jgi:cytochrome bd ubiquinol oxidase subunit I
MNGAVNRKLLFVLGPVTGLVIFAGVVFIATFLTNREYSAPYRAPAAAVDATPRTEGLTAEASDAAERARATPYVDAEYREFPVVGSRVAVWAIAQLHLLFAAFVLAVPIFAFIIEAIGYKTGDSRYDRLAHEFTKLLSVSFSLTATFGAFLTFLLIALYPKFTNYLMSVFSPTFLPYVLLFFAEAAFLYTYYYGWGKFHPLVHLGLGLGLNLVGTAIMFIANSWLTFMMSPRGISDAGAVISVWEAVDNFTWMPINVHRMIANVAFGGSVAAAYAAFKFLQAETDEERAHYDWMGYIGNFVAISAFLPLPFAGYWLAKEIYAYSQTLGLTMMGGAFSWLFIIQAVLIGNLFLAANYYLWLGMGRVQGAQPLQKFVKYLLIAIALCFAVWATPRSIIATVSEIRAMGGSAHPILGFLGVMSAKNTAVNILILTTYMSFLLYRRTGKTATVPWAKAGHAAQLGIFATAAFIVVFLGVYGYFVEATVRIGLSVPQVGSVLFAMVSITIIDVFLFRGARFSGDVRWGRMPAISQYVLIFIAVTFTWLMGLMGYVRSGLRQHWHVYGVIRDTSPGAFTPTLGFATEVVSVTVLAFFLLIGFVFWITSLHDRPEYVPAAKKAAHEGGHVVFGSPVGHHPGTVTEMRSLSTQDIEGQTGRLS